MPTKRRPLSWVNNSNISWYLKKYLYCWFDNYGHKAQISKWEISSACFGYANHKRHISFMKLVFWPFWLFVIFWPHFRSSTGQKFQIYYHQSKIEPRPKRKKSRLENIWTKEKTLAHWLIFIFTIFINGFVRLTLFNTNVIYEMSI